MSGLKQKAKTLKVGVVPWQLWIKSPAYLKLTPEKKIKSLLTIIERKENEITKLKDLLENYNDQALAYEKSVEERLGQILELIHIGKLAPTCNKHPSIEFCKQCKECEVGEELVGLLGQNLEKHQPKKEENPK